MFGTIKLKGPIAPHFKIAFLSSISRFLYVAITLYTIKVITGLITVNEYAVFSIIINVCTWYLLVDLGIGSSLQNYITEKNILSEKIADFALIAYILLILLSFIWLIFLFFLSPYASHFLFKQFEIKNGQHLFFVSSVIGILTGVGTVSYKILNALKLNYLPSLFSAIGAIFSLVIILVLKNRINLNLFGISISYLSGTFLAAVIPFIYFANQFIQTFVKRNIKQMFYESSKLILTRGLKFWIFNLFSALVLQIDYIVMSQLVSAGEITNYNIIMRVFGIGFMVYTMLLNAVWPSFTEMNILNKSEEIIQKCFSFIKIGILGTIILSVGLFFFQKNIFALLASFPIKVSSIVIILIMIYYMIRVWTDTFSIVLLSSNSFKPLMIFTPLQALLAILFELVLGAKFGITGIVSGLIISFLCTVSWALPYYSYKKKK